jgi:hypothetical protein
MKDRVLARGIVGLVVSFLWRSYETAFTYYLNHHISFVLLNLNRVLPGSSGVLGQERASD